MLNFKNRAILCLKTVMLAIFSLFLTVQAEKHLMFTPPSDSGWINVKTDLGCKGDGKTDDTAAFKAFKPQNAHDVGTFYFPEGVYVISDTIDFGGSKRVLIQGDGPKKSVILLKASSPGYNNPKKPKPAVIIGHSKLIDEKAKSYPGHGQAFRNSVFNMGFVVDKGNTGAMALAYHNNNQGAIENVVIKSLDGQGHSGLGFNANWPGPALVNDLTVEGFDYGVWSIIGQYSMTFEHLHLKNQNKVAFYNRSQHLNIRDFRSENKVTALKIIGYSTVVNLIDAKLTGGDAEAVAIESLVGDNKNKDLRPPLFVRNLEVEGYGSAIVNGTTLPSAMTIKATMVDEFFSHQPYAVGSKATKTLAMKVLETPFLDPGPVAQWVSVKSFKPTIIKGKDKKGKDTETEDWSSAIQSAIDSGAKTIYFPKSQYTVYNTIEIRGSCQVLMGMDSSMKPQGFGNNPDKPVFKITTDEAVMVSRLSDSYGDAYHFFHHESKGDLILRNSITGGYKNFKEGGRVFLHDICGSKFEFKGQEVYARQLNTEADVKKEGAFNVHLQGGSLWCLGQKLEHKCPAIVAKQAKVEVLGLWTYHGGKGPLLTNDQGQMCVTGINMSTGTYGTVVSEESSNGKGEIQLKHNAPNQGSFRKYGAIMPLYFGH